MIQRQPQADPDVTGLLTLIEQVEGDVFHHVYEGLLFSADRIETRLLALQEAAQMVLDFWGLSTPEFVARYGHGVTTRVVADRLRAALTMPDRNEDTPCQP